MFFKFLKIHFKMTKETDFSKIYIKDFNVDKLNDITLNDINAFLSYLALNQRKQTCHESEKGLYNKNIFCIFIFPPERSAPLFLAISSKTSIVSFGSFLYILFAFPSLLLIDSCFFP